MQAYEYLTHFQEISYEMIRSGGMLFKHEFPDHTTPMASNFAAAASEVLCRFGGEGWALVSTETVWAKPPARGNSIIDGVNPGSPIITGFLFFLQRPLQA